MTIRKLVEVTLGGFHEGTAHRLTLLAIACLGFGFGPASAQSTTDRTARADFHLTVSLIPADPQPDSLFVTIRMKDGILLDRYAVAYKRDVQFSTMVPTHGTVRVECVDSNGRRAREDVDLDLLFQSKADSAMPSGVAVVKPQLTLRAPEAAAAKPPPLLAAPPAGDGGSADLDWQRIFFATDRTEDPTAKDPEKRFGHDYSDVMSFGDAIVTFPHDHHMGKIERPAWWRFEIHVNPERHVTIRSVATTTRDSFWLALDQEVQHWPERRVLIFVHGYNVDFEGAVLRSAQVAFDVRYAGAAILFTWPSLGTFSGYSADEATCEASTPHFEAMLDTLMERTSVQSVEIVAHSMGTRIVTRALADLKDRGRLNSAVQVSQLVLAAADMDARTFRELATHLQGAASRITLYGSSKDKAIKASKSFHHDARAGDGGQNIVVVPGVETIDASAVATDFIDHGYIGDNRTVIGDLHGVLMGQSTQERFYLVGADKAGVHYWLFRP